MARKRTQYDKAVLASLFAAAKAIKAFCDRQIDSVLEEGDDACDGCPFLKSERCVFSCGASEWEV